MFFRELYIIFKQDNFFTEFLFTLGSCNHVAGMLFRIEAAVLLGVTHPTCTMQLAKWNIPSKKKIYTSWKAFQFYNQARSI